MFLKVWRFLTLMLAALALTMTSVLAETPRRASGRVR